LQIQQLKSYLTHNNHENLIILGNISKDHQRLLMFDECLQMAKDYRSDTIYAEIISDDGFNI
jgi:hypothetical protein